MAMLLRDNIYSHAHASIVGFSLISFRSQGYKGLSMHWINCFLLLVTHHILLTSQMFFTVTSGVPLATGTYSHGSQSAWGEGPSFHLSSDCTAAQLQPLPAPPSTTTHPLHRVLFLLKIESTGNEDDVAS